MAPSWHRRGTVLALSWHRRGTVLTPSWHRRGTVVAPSWHCRDTVVALSWHCRSTLVALLYHCCNTVIAQPVHPSQYYLDVRTKKYSEKYSNSCIAQSRILHSFQRFCRLTDEYSLQYDQSMLFHLTLTLVFLSLEIILSAFFYEALNDS